MRDIKSTFCSTFKRMEEHTLKLAQKLAKEAVITEDEENSALSEARDGHPTPLRSNAASKLEEKVKGFR